MCIVEHQLMEAREVIAYKIFIINGEKLSNLFWGSLPTQYEVGKSYTAEMYRDMNRYGAMFHSFPTLESAREFFTRYNEYNVYNGDTVICEVKLTGMIYEEGCTDDRFNLYCEKLLDEIQTHYFTCFRHQVGGRQMEIVRIVENGPRIQRYTLEYQLQYERI